MKGYPDFFGQGTFLKRGPTYSDFDSGLIDAAGPDLVTIFTITAKGELYGGSIFLIGRNAAHGSAGNAKALFASAGLFR